MPLSVHENSRQVALAHAVSRGSSAFTTMNTRSTAQIIEEAEQFLAFLKPGLAPKARSSAHAEIDALIGGWLPALAPGTFMWALRHMEAGRRVRRKGLDYGGWVNHNIKPEDIRATDWEIVE